MKGTLRKLTTIIVTLSLILPCIPTVYAGNSMIVKDIDALRAKFKRDIEEINKRTIPQTTVPPITSEQQAELDKINNNPISGSGNDASLSITGTDAQLTPSAIATPAPESMLMSAALVSARSSAYTSDDFKIEPVASVYNVLNNNNDYVSQATGTLTYEKTLLSLPGKNGLDLNLSVKYNSEDAVITQNQFASTNESVRNINFNSFASGWSFGFPTITKSNVEKNYGWRKETSLNFPDGSGYEIKNDIENPSTDTVLQLNQYKLSDMTLVKKANSNNYELTYSSGTVYTFDGTYGNLIKIKDVFGNEITFHYSELDYYKGTFFDYVFDASQYSAKLNALTKIVDSTGREIDIEYRVDKMYAGTEINAIYVKSGGKWYATIYLDRFNSYCGTTDVVTKIEDAEGYATTYEYKEKVSHIFSRNLDDPSGFSYTVNGSVIALSKANLPTGGWVAYDYTKARRAYRRFNPYASYDPVDWYEVYKVSKISDTNGYERTYKYENDRSGYPYSNLDAEPIGQPSETTTGTYTGNVVDSGFRYFCIINEGTKTTVTTFDYQHKKIKEQSYGEYNTQNSYHVGYGRSKHSVVVNGTIYHMGSMNNSVASGNDGIYFYCQYPESDSIYFLAPCPEKITGNYQLKTTGGTLYLFYRKGSGTTADPYKFVAKAYNTAGNFWYDAGEKEVTGTAAEKLTLSNMYYTGTIFYSYAHTKMWNTTNSLYHITYDPTKSDLNSRWTITNQANVYINGNPDTTFIHNQCVGTKAYYTNSGNIIEYDLVTGTLTSKSISGLSTTGTNIGFSLDGKTYCSNYDSIVEFSYSSGTIVKTYTLPDSSAYNSFFVQKSTDGYAHFISKYPDAAYNCPIYRFNPYSETPFTVVGNTLVNTVTLEDKTEPGVAPTLMASNGCLYLCGDGVEKIYVTEPSTTQLTTLTSTFYNSYDQPTETTVTKFSGSQSRDGGTEICTYMDGRNVVSSTTDVLGNVTEYEYTDSTYYIPTKTTQYAGTVNELETVYTLSADKTKVMSAETYYDDVTLKTVYEYTDTAHPGNVTKETVYQAQSGSTEYTIVSQVEYGYDSTGTFIETTTQKNVETNSVDFESLPAHDITTSVTRNMHGQITSQTDALGRTTQYTYNNNGWQTSVTTPDGVTTQTVYDINGEAGENIIKTIYSNGYEATDYYDETGLLLYQTEKSSNGTEKVVNTYNYFARMLIIKYDSVWNHEGYSYDKFNRLVGYTNSDGSWDVTDRSFSVSNDDFNFAKITNNGGKISTTYYDLAGREIRTETQTDAGLAVSYTTYDYMGNVNSTTTPMGETTLYSYNDRGLLLSTTDALGGVVSYTYDILGNPLTVTNAGRVIQTNTYDNIGRLLSTTDAMGYVELYSYDDHNRMIKSIDKNGQFTTYTYKPNTDYVQEQVIDNSMAFVYTYDTLGNVISIFSLDGTFDYTYTDNNLLESIEYPDGKKITYIYDDNHNLEEVIDYSGDIINYTYDSAYNVTSISRDDTVVANYTYNPDGTVKTANYPGQGTTQYTYDNAMRLTFKRNNFGTGSNYELHEYIYDLNGNITTYYEPMWGNYYTYDALGRLIQFVPNLGESETYTYDAFDNIISTSYFTNNAGGRYIFKQNGVEYTLDNLSSHEKTYTYDNNNRLISESEQMTGTGPNYSGSLVVTKQHEYDNNGNLLKTTKGGQIDTEIKTYGYNAINQLSYFIDEDGNIAYYSYDPYGRRIFKSQNSKSILFYWDRNYISAESVNGSITAKNYIGNDGIFARETNAGADYMFKNGHGDVSAIVNNGTLVGQHRYRPYGEEAYPFYESDNPYGYCGEYLDSESGLIYLRNRYYDPSTGRFITEDPVKDGLNWYAYCGNNPVNMVDPSGLDAVLITADHAAMWQGHTSIITQDTRNGNWYYFYWGDKATYFVEVPWEDGAMGSLENFNSWLNKQDLPYSTKNYTSATFVEGDFNASVDYFKNLVSGTTIEKGYRMEAGRYDKPTMEYYQINKSYDLWDANCLQMSMKGFYKGTLMDGTKVSSFMKGQLDKTKLANVRPNTAEEVFNQLFFNRRFTRASAKNDVTWEALYGSPNDRYKNKGFHYAKTLGVSK